MQTNWARWAGAVAVLGMMLAGDLRAAAGSTLFEAIRNNDVAAVRAAIGQGADVKVPDDTGATPLMYAALYAGPACLQALLDRGALVNTGNAYGSTPLMWAATANAANVRLLLDRGADVDAAAKDGVTALAAAARLNNTAAMRLLLMAGADTRKPATRTNLLTAAYAAPDAGVRQVLAAAGVVLASPQDIKGPALYRNRGDLPTLERMIAAGIDPNEQVALNTISLPSFLLAARDGRLAETKVFVDAGVDPNITASRGWTALMVVAGGDNPSIPVMQYLIDAGADLNAVDDDGRSALDWAWTRGATSASRFLEAAGAKRASTPTTAPTPVSTPRTPTAAVERAVARLQPVGPTFINRTKCNSCHNQNIPGMAITLARHHGISIDETLAGHSMDATNRVMDTRRETMILGDTTNGGFQPNAAYMLLEMAEDHMPPTVNSDVNVIGLASRQNADGSWAMGNEIRPPLNGGVMTGTALAIRALREYAPPGHRAAIESHAARAVEFVRRNQPADTQEQVFKMLGLIWSGAPEVETAKEKAALIALQRADGGWGQLPSMASDAYATGQALWALHGAGMSAADPAYRSGAAYLLRTQLEDGTWFVQTRAFGFQTYFETGFPHGRSQFISTAATSWAAIALTYTIEPVRVSDGQSRASGDRQPPIQ